MGSAPTERQQPDVAPVIESAAAIDIISVTEVAHRQYHRRFKQSSFVQLMALTLNQIDGSRLSVVFTSPTWPIYRRIDTR